jgi:phosphonate transport system substrate-binding protein
MAAQPLMFLLDTNLGLYPDEEPWSEFFARTGIATSSTTDLVELDASVERHEPDMVFMPIADFHRLLAGGDGYYRGFALLTSKFTGSTSLPSVLVVCRDDAATCLDDLAGSTYGYINRSCTSSFYSPAILLAHQGKTLEQFFTIEQTTPWQGQIDAVVSGRVRSTMVPEDVWKSKQANAEDTKVIGRYDNATGAVVVVRDGLDESMAKRLLDALVAWQPRPEAVFGGFAPYQDHHVRRLFDDLDRLRTASDG